MSCSNKLDELKALGLKVTGVACVGDTVDEVICSIKNNYKDLSQVTTITITTDQQSVVPALGTTFLKANALSNSEYVEILTGGKVTNINEQSFMTAYTYMLAIDDFVDLKGGLNYAIYNDGNNITITMCDEL